MHLLIRWLGLGNGTDIQYLWWSGIGSDLTEFALLGALVKVYVHLNCTVKGCRRIGKHPVDGTPYRTCHRHATVAHHSTLTGDHARKHPDQHELLNSTDNASVHDKLDRILAHTDDIHTSVVPFGHPPQTEGGAT